MNINNKRVIWIIDGSYMMKSAPGRLDYLKLKTLLEGPGPEQRQFYECYYLDSLKSSMTDAKDSFLTWLKLAPPNGPKFRLQLYKLKELHVSCPKCKHAFERMVQKGVDVGIATLLIKLAIQNKYDRLLLSAGDGDFEDAISYVKSELNKEIFIAAFQGSVSADLQSYADKVVWLDDHWDDIKREELNCASNTALDKKFN